jgi:hypothetical protein
MAARESQGFQIALIVFVMLTVLLSLTTFVFFRNYQSEQQKSKDAQAAASTANQKASDLQAERDQYLTNIGVPAAEKKEAIQEIWTKDMNAAAPLLGANLPDDQKTYRKVLDMLQAVIRKNNADLQKQASDLREAKALYETKTTTYESELKRLAAENEAKINDYMQARATITDQNQQLNESNKHMADDMAKNEKTAMSDKAQLQGQIAKLEESIKKMQTQLRLKSDDLNKLSGKFDVNAHPNGKIVWVNALENLAYINLGSDDRLRKRVTFSVFDPSTTDVSALKPKTDTSSSSDSDKAVSEAQSKGSIEVINITGPHMSVCRILNDTNAKPILPEDVIFTPLWRAGQQEHFALMGAMDVDGDGINNRAKIHDLIRQSGGIIDAEVDEKGNLQGAVTYETRYLVKGKGDAHEGSSRTGADKLLSDATKLGVDTIDLAKFLDMMGYVSKSAEEKTSAAVNIAPPYAGEPNSNFRPRKPPAAKANGVTAF